MQLFWTVHRCSHPNHGQGARTHSVVLEAPGQKLKWPHVPGLNLAYAFKFQSSAETSKQFPMVTIEKGQGVTLGTGPGNYAEDKILATLKRVKAVDKNISTIFYYNRLGLRLLL